MANHVYKKVMRMKNCLRANAVDVFAAARRREVYGYFCIHLCSMQVAMCIQMIVKVV